MMRKTWQTHSLKRRYFLFTILFATVLVLLFLVFAIVFNFNGRNTEGVKDYFESEYSHFESTITTNFGRQLAKWLSYAGEISRRYEQYAYEHDIDLSSLQKYPEKLEEIIASQIPYMIGLISDSETSGLVVIMDATVNPALDTAATSRAGFGITKYLLNNHYYVNSKLYCYRGSAEIARRNGIELQSIWRREFDTNEFTCFSKVMETAKNNPHIPSTKQYYWSSRISGENGDDFIYLCVPMITTDGYVFGMCAFAISHIFFKQTYSPSGTMFSDSFAVFAPYTNGRLETKRGMIAGNSYLTSLNKVGDLQTVGTKFGLELFESETRYAGISGKANMYASNSPYYEEQWAIAVMCDADAVQDKASGNFFLIILVCMGILLIALIIAFISSYRYTKPIDGLVEQIKENDFSSSYAEINDLMEYLRQRDEETQTKTLSPAIVVSDPELMPRFEEFMNNIKTLSPAERNVFNLYIEGYRATEIADKLFVSINTIKTHNRRIFAKLNVSTRKELMVYIDIMKELGFIRDDIGDDDGKA